MASGYGYGRPDKSDKIDATCQENSRIWRAIYLLLNALRAFEAAARLGSLSEARELHVTHGAISRQVKQLEEQLGVGLFVGAKGAA